MGELKLHLKHQKCLEDITSDSFAYEFPEEQEVNGHLFRHVAYGMYKAEPPFELNKKEVKPFLAGYRDLVLVYYIVENAIRVIYGYSGECVRLKKPVYDFQNAYRELKGEALSENELDLWYGPPNLYHVHYEKICRYTSDREAIEEEDMPASQKVMQCVLPKDLIRNAEDGKLPGRIWFGGFVGEMAEEGIYYFKMPVQSKYERSMPRMWFGRKQEIKSAAVIFQEERDPSKETERKDCVNIEYMVLDKKYYPRLKEIAELTGKKYYEMEDYEFSNDYRKREMHEDLDRILKMLYSVCPPKLRTKTEIERAIEEGAEELAEGLGFLDLEIRYEIPMLKKTDFMSVRAAYKSGTELVLVKETGLRKLDEETGAEPREGSCLYIERYDMRLMSRLDVRKIIPLKCGKEYPVIYTLISCGEEKLKELMTDEAYELFQQAERRYAI